MYLFTRCVVAFPWIQSPGVWCLLRASRLKRRNIKQYFCLPTTITWPTMKPSHIFSSQEHRVMVGYESPRFQSFDPIPGPKPILPLPPRVFRRSAPQQSTRGGRGRYVRAGFVREKARRTHVKTGPWTLAKRDAKECKLQRSQRPCLHNCRLENRSLRVQSAPLQSTDSSEHAVAISAGDSLKVPPKKVTVSGHTLQVIVREGSFNMTRGEGGGWRYWGGAPKIFRHPKGGLWQNCWALGEAPKICTLAISRGLQR